MNMAIPRGPRTLRCIQILRRVACAIGEVRARWARKRMQREMNWYRAWERSYGR